MTTKTVELFGKRYTADISFLSVAQFCANKSSLMDAATDLSEEENIKTLMQFLYEKIRFDGTWEEFTKAAAETREKYDTVLDCALSLALDAIWIDIPTTKKTKAKQDRSGRSVELSLLSLALALGIDSAILGGVTFGGAYNLIRTLAELKGGGAEKKYKKLAKNEISKMYGG